MKIAVVGTGISGLVSAYLLHRDHDVYVLEANDYIGGHTNTIEVMEGKQMIPVDTGFIVFNAYNYPNLCRLFSMLEVASRHSEMSFSVACEGSGLEYIVLAIEFYTLEAAYRVSGRWKKEMTRPVRRCSDLRAECKRFFRSALFFTGWRPIFLSLISSQTCSSGLYAGA